jgi:hypothetical protein
MPDPILMPRRGESVTGIAWQGSPAGEHPSAVTEGEEMPKEYRQW